MDRRFNHCDCGSQSFKIVTDSKNINAQITDDGILLNLDSEENEDISNSITILDIYCLDCEKNISLSDFELKLTDVSIPVCFENTTYKNDVCPSYTYVLSNEYLLKLWIEPELRHKREDYNSKRHSLCLVGHDGEQGVLSTTDLWNIEETETAQKNLDEIALKTILETINFICK